MIPFTPKTDISAIKALIHHRLRKLKVIVPILGATFVVFGIVVGFTDRDLFSTALFGVAGIILILTPFVVPALLAPHIAANTAPANKHAKYAIQENGDVLITLTDANPPTTNTDETAKPLQFSIVNKIIKFGETPTYIFLHTDAQNAFVIAKSTLPKLIANKVHTLYKK